MGAGAEPWRLPSLAGPLGACPPFVGALFQSTFTSINSPPWLDSPDPPTLLPPVWAGSLPRGYKLGAGEGVQARRGDNPENLDSRLVPGLLSQSSSECKLAEVSHRGPARLSPEPGEAWLPTQPHFSGDQAPVDLRPK